MSGPSRTGKRTLWTSPLGSVRFVRSVRGGGWSRLPYEPLSFVLACNKALSVNGGLEGAIECFELAIVQPAFILIRRRLLSDPGEVALSNVAVVDRAHFWPRWAKRPALCSLLVERKCDNVHEQASRFRNRFAARRGRGRCLCLDNLVHN